MKCRSIEQFDGRCTLYFVGGFWVGSPHSRNSSIINSKGDRAGENSSRANKPRSHSKVRQNLCRTSRPTPCILRMQSHAENFGLGSSAEDLDNLHSYGNIVQSPRSASSCTASADLGRIHKHEVALRLLSAIADIPVKCATLSATPRTGFAIDRRRSKSRHRSSLHSSPLL